LVTDEGIHAISKGCTRISIMDLRHCKSLTDDCTLFLEFDPYLTILHFGNCPLITDLTLKRIQVCSNLEVLNMENLESITDDALIKYLPRSVRTLNIKNTKISEKSILELTFLQNLNLAGCNISPSIRDLCTHLQKLVI